MRPFHRLVVLLLAALVAAPALAYTIFLKDGSQLLAKQKYEVRGDRAIILLPSGTQTAIALSEIDIPRTEKANVQDLGTAILIEDGKATGMPAAPPKSDEAKLADLIRSGSAGVRDTGVPATPGGPTGAAARPRGFSDEVAPTASRVALRDSALGAQLKDFIGSRGLPVEVAQGSSARRPLLVYETDSEGPVFRALLASAAALIETRSRTPGALEGVDVLCETSDGSLAARFELDPQQAADLLAGRAEVTRFFVENVLF
ncbi:MAG: hypothetical protein F9K18_10450 [Thermoanaerobaculia bacterium]|nr:MAG: hypothetical protein F9K18_10450 [Thermoanaerobaculia bacterium]